MPMLDSSSTLSFIILNTVANGMKNNNRRHAEHLKFLASGRSNSWRGQSLKIPKTSCFLATDCRKIFSWWWRKYSFDQFRLFKLQAEEASRYNANVWNISWAIFKRFNVSIFFVKLSTIIYLTNQTMIPESGITRRRQAKNVHSVTKFFLFCM